MKDSSIKYYDIEVLSVPAGDTIDLVRDDNCAIYECPATGAFKSRGKKHPLFMAFRERNNNGRMTHLYKIQKVLSADLDDENFLMDSAKMNEERKGSKCSSLWKRIDYYKRNNKNANKGGLRWIFVIDVENSIELPFPAEFESTRGMAGEVHLTIKEFFGHPTEEGVVMIKHKKM